MGGWVNGLGEEHLNQHRLRKDIYSMNVKLVCCLRTQTEETCMTDTNSLQQTYNQWARLVEKMTGEQSRCHTKKIISMKRNKPC